MTGSSYMIKKVRKGIYVPDIGNLTTEIKDDA